MSRNDSLKKGKNNIDMIVLSILNDGNEYYGYQLSQLISEYSGGRISIPEGSLYPALYRLLDKQFISDEKRVVGKRLSRIYYRIKPAGIEYYQTLLEDYISISEGIRNILYYKKNSDSEEV